MNSEEDIKKFKDEYIKVLLDLLGFVLFYYNFKYDSKKNKYIHKKYDNKIVEKKDKQKEIIEICNNYSEKKLNDKIFIKKLNILKDDLEKKTKENYIDLYDNIMF